MLRALLVSLCALDIYGAHAINSLTIDTTSGSVRGFVNETTPHVAQFLGVPYTEPPVGARRWLPPQAKTRENDTIDATRFGPACSQFVDEGDGTAPPNVYTVDAPEFNIFPPQLQGEDCLSVNIWTPRNDLHGKNGTGLPVVVWLYGGGFGTGGANVPYQNPAPWVERSKSHIVVSVNYRGGIFGFPNAAGLELSNQNLGLLDQRMAIEWVRDNIAAFGGSAKRITLWGQSAGAMSADYYNFAYPDDPIVTGMIMHSGSAQTPFMNEDVKQTNFSFVASHFNCSSTDAVVEVDCLRGIDATSLFGFLKTYAESGAQPGLSWVPIIDNRTNFANYTARILSGRFSRIPALLGTTKDEASSFVLPYIQTHGPDPAEVDAMTKWLFLCPIVQSTKERYQANVTTFRYLYAGNFSNISPQWWEGAYHSSDLPMVFGTYGIARGAGTAFQDEVSEQMQDYWLAFARDPVRGLPSLGWNTYKGGAGDVALLGENGTVIQPIAERAVEGLCNGTIPGDNNHHHG